MPSGWTYDTSSRALVSGTYFPVQFDSSHVAFRNIGTQSIVECSASDYDTTSTTKYGGGVKTVDLVFTKGVLKGSFRMVHPTGSIDSTEIQKSISRSQASFWCIGVLGSNDNNTEIDVWEAAGGNRLQANHIEWTRQGAIPHSPDGPTIQLYYYQVVQTDPTPWTAFASLTSWGTWQVDNNYPDVEQKAVFTGGGKTLTALNIQPASTPMGVIVHNKPWRFTNPAGGVKAGAGPTATLQCDWVEWN